MQLRKLVAASQSRVKVSSISSKKVLARLTDSDAEDEEEVLKPDVDDEPTVKPEVDDE